MTHPKKPDVPVGECFSNGRVCAKCGHTEAQQTTTRDPNSIFQQDGLPERDASKPAEHQGLFRKFNVSRTDGSDAPGGKHENCEYFVLDVGHDKHAPAALLAYAEACRLTHPELAADLIERYELTSAQQAEPAQATCACRWDGETQTARCELHQAHKDAIHEWAERAKAAEAKLAQQAGMVLVPIAVLEAAAKSLADYVGDRDWGDGDLDAMGDINSIISKHKVLAAAPKQAEPAQAAVPSDERAAFDQIVTTLRLAMDAANFYGDKRPEIIGYFCNGLNELGTQPVREPMSDEQIDNALPEIVSGGNFTVITYGRAVARAIERFHGITKDEPQVCGNCGEAPPGCGGRRGFFRAVLGRGGKVVIERAHYEAVCRGITEQPRPKIIPPRKAA